MHLLDVIIQYSNQAAVADQTELSFIWWQTSFSCVMVAMSKDANLRLGSPIINEHAAGHIVWLDEQQNNRKSI